ncbi:MAG: hypothetical protein JNL24_00960 [Bacteroidia bacterium]|nr:hypothetical protein [Bacteroidia bacterium]
MKKTGIAITLIGLPLMVLSMLDLFGEQRLPVPVTVPIMIISCISVFLGPALAVFPLSMERRKRITNRSLVLGLSLFGLGFFFKKMHWPGAAFLVIIGVLILCFFSGTLTCKSNYDKWKLLARTKFDALFLTLCNYVGIGGLLLGILFKIQHWPLAQAIAIGGMVTLAAGMLIGNHKFKKEVITRKETADKLKETLDQLEEQHQILEEKQKEIIGSITYAKRIQSSLLPTEKYINSHLERLRNSKRL